ncbi:MAG TPA: ribosome maturation factor RimP [Desulfobulbus sp.]|nr:ribosome maturation factor RimP [Desulfobulbus sp.]
MTGVRKSGLCPLFLLPFIIGKTADRNQVWHGVRGQAQQDLTGETTQVVSSGTERIISTIQEFAEPVLAERGLELVEIQFRPEAHGWVLRLFIDKEGGVTIDDCADVSREISAYLEVEDLIEHSYHLEVSSPGLERPLRRREDFERFSGRKARIKLKEPQGEQRVFVGTLAGVENETVLLLVDGREQRFALNGIARARLAL